MDRWKMFSPIVLASFGVADPLAGVPPMLLVDSMPPFDVGGGRNDRLYLRVCNDDPSLAPPGHAVVQALLKTDYAWWASRGAGYEAAKEQTAEVALAQIERVAPGLRSRVRMTDLATPLTFWHKARSWRGAYEGWMPNEESLLGHVPKTLPGLESFYMAGQWVEPGGGVPTAVMSGRQAAQLLCVDQARPFVAEPCKAIAR
jgi:phytoene dehydrogenase-like protein